MELTPECVNKLVNTHTLLKINEIILQYNIPVPASRNPFCKPVEGIHYIPNRLCRLMVRLPQSGIPNLDFYLFLFRHPEAKNHFNDILLYEIYPNASVMDPYLAQCTLSPEKILEIYHDFGGIIPALRELFSFDSLLFYQDKIDEMVKALNQLGNNVDTININILPKLNRDGLFFLTLYAIINAGIKHTGVDDQDILADIVINYMKKYVQNMD
jgi:hypothetical protein